LEGYFRGCLRLFRAISGGYFGGVLEGFYKVLEGKTITIEHKEKTGKTYFR
jgi:hypothetical protein